MRDGDHPQYLSDAAIGQMTMNVFDAYFPTHSLEDFKSQMRRFGFTDSWDMDLLESKYFYNMSARAIANEQSYISHDTVSRRLKQLHVLLKERGYPKGNK